MVKVTVEEAGKRFSELVDYVRQKNESIVVAGPNGELVKIIPIPKPVETWKGRPVYKLEDVQYLDAPWWFE
jgi:antitoxin (DNA-binding transcriptional repressor) of toxin-antitoxin stability system